MASASASARIEGVIERQKGFGIRGANLGASYEARAQIAIWAGDPVAFDSYGRLTASEYRHGQGSPFGARYERLVQDAQRAGLFTAQVHAGDSSQSADDAMTRVETPAATPIATATRFIGTAASRRTRRD